MHRLIGTINHDLESRVSNNITFLSKNYFSAWFLILKKMHCKINSAEKNSQIQKYFISIKIKLCNKPI